MIELLSMNVLWWHWIILGVVLIASEMFIPSFIVLWFGISGVSVGLADLAFETSFLTEMWVWLVMSVFFLSLWFAFVKPRFVSNTGQSENSFDTQGTVTQAISVSQRGKVQFDIAVLGDTLWTATSKEDLTVGDRVEIAEVDGQLISVNKIK